MWKYSRIRYYLINMMWNYKFWLFSEKLYKNHTYDVVDENIDLSNVDVTGKINFKSKKITKRRFVGYKYNNRIYLDNPGVKDFVDKDVWDKWKSKGFI